MKELVFAVSKFLIGFVYHCVVFLDDCRSKDLVDLRMGNLDILKTAYDLGKTEY